MECPVAPISPAYLRMRFRTGNILHRGEIGWTLVEMVMVIVVLGAIAAVGASLIPSIFDSYFASRDITSSDGQARAAFERMTRELRQIRSATATDLDVASATQIRFMDADGNGICFYRDAVNNRLMRSADGPATACGSTNAQPMADYVTGMNFFYYQNDGATTTVSATSVYYITVRVNVQDNNITDTLRATIHPRNL